MVDTAQAVFVYNEIFNIQYDVRDNLWDPWLQSRIHEFIATSLLLKKSSFFKAIDAGCGSGQQTFLLSQAGYKVTGIDLANKLLAFACSKIPSYAVLPLQSPPFFYCKNIDFPWLNRHHKNLFYILEKVRQGRKIQIPQFIQEDLSKYDFGNMTQDVIVCCGSVLSFVNDYSGLLEKMAKGLRPGGLLFLEVEQKLNMERIWPVLDRLLGGKLGYNNNWREIFGNLFSPSGCSIQTSYHLPVQNNKTIDLTYWSFSIKEFESLFKKYGLRCKRKRGLHCVTNLFLPSPLLYRFSSPHPILKRFFEFLISIEARTAEYWPVWRLGSNIIYCLEKI